MVKGDSKSPEFWMEKALKHLREAREQMEKGDREDAAFWVHQSIEFGLKAAQVSVLGKTKKAGHHDLRAYLHLLLDSFPHESDLLQKYEGLMDKIDPLYKEGRYPMGDVDLPQAEEIEMLMEEAGQFLDVLNKLIKKAR